jgi:hypothetical protein
MMMSILRNDADIAVVGLKYVLSSKAVVLNFFLLHGPLKIKKLPWA